MPLFQDISYFFYLKLGVRKTHTVKFPISYKFDLFLVFYVVHTSSSSPPDTDTSFPIILHPPFPILTPSPTHYSSPDSSPPQISSIPSHTSINCQGPNPIPVPGSIIGPILGPAAPPYSDSSGSELVSDSTTARLQSVQQFPVELYIGHQGQIIYQ